MRFLPLVLAAMAALAQECAHDGGTLWKAYFGGMVDSAPSLMRSLASKYVSVAAGHAFSACGNNGCLQQEVPISVDEWNEEGRIWEDGHGSPFKNTYAEIGTTWASSVVTFPTVAADLMGQLM